MELVQSFPEVPKLLTEMLAHRGRVVRQIAGAPLAAMNAALAQSHVLPGNSLTGVEASPSPWLRQWLDTAAQKSFFWKDIYETFLPWGQDNARRRHAQERAERQTRSLIERLKEDRAQSVMAMTLEDTAFLDKTDRELLSVMVRQGYLQAMPHHRNLRSLDLTSGPVAYSMPGAPGHTRLVGDRLGDFYNSLPLSAEGQKALADKVSQGHAPVSLTDHVHQVYTRWYILFHEVAHCEFRRLEEPFQPTPGAITPDQCRALNRWVTGSARVTSLDAATLLNENHSDVLASMLLLEATNHDPRAIRALRARIEERRETRKKGDITTIDALGKGVVLGGRFACVHASEWAMERVLNNVSEWKGKPPEQIRALALRYASDGLLDFVHPERTLAGKPIGAILAANLLPPIPQVSALLEHLEAMVMSYAHGGDPVGWLKAQPDHPATDVLAQAWSHALPVVRKSLSEDLPGNHGLPITVGDGLRRFDSRAFEVVRKFLNEVAPQCLNPELPQVQRMNKAFATDYEQIQQGLGLNPSPATQLSVEEWRSVRSNPSMPALPSTAPSFV